ncbi:MAG: hypothetical protein KL785_08900 [Brevundimonas sp.]|nr:hypothetical protein [Brevundimonas sp.]
METLFVIQHLQGAAASHGTVSGDKKGGAEAPPSHPARYRSPRDGSLLERDRALSLAARRLAV